MAWAVPLETPLALPIVVPLAGPLTVPLASSPAAPLAASNALEPQSPPKPVQMEHWRGLQENVELTPHGSRVHKLERTTPRGSRLMAEYTSPHSNQFARYEALQKLRLSTRSVTAQARKRRKAGVPARRMGQQREEAQQHRVPWGWHQGRWDDTLCDTHHSAEELQAFWVEGGGRGGHYTPTRRQPAEVEAPSETAEQCECSECAPCKERLRQLRKQEALAENAKCECASRSGPERNAEEPSDSPAYMPWWDSTAWKSNWERLNAKRKAKDLRKKCRD